MKSDHNFDLIISICHKIDEHNDVFHRKNWGALALKNITTTTEFVMIFPVIDDLSTAPTREKKPTYTYLFQE